MASGVNKGLLNQCVWGTLMHMHPRLAEKKLLTKVIIFVFFAHKKYSCCIITLQLNHWCHMDCFNDVLTTFMGLECGSCVAVYAGSEPLRFHQKDELMSYGFGTTWGWVINDRIWIFGWTIPLRKYVGSLLIAQWLQTQKQTAYSSAYFTAQIICHWFPGTIWPLSQYDIGFMWSVPS